jgi:TonB family protein
LESRKGTSFSAQLRRGILLFTFFVFILIPIAHTQPADDQGLAPSVAEALARSKVNSVVVFDFLGPGDSLHQLGVDLADTFSRSLAKSAANIVVIDRSQVRAMIEKNRVAPTVVRDSEIAWWFAHQLKAQSLVLGQIAPADGGKVQLTVSAATVQQGKNIENFSLDIPLTPEMKDHFAKTLSSISATPAVAPGTTIGKVPTCHYCPPPKYSKAALTLKQQGAVRLVGVVGVDGVVRDIDFVNGATYGLTQQAIEAVQSWRMDPGKDTKGRPIEMRQTIEVNFLLGR